ncbi:MAG: hydroxymethylglutaryl-CoA synthase [Lactobacillus sp.]|nr:hydroxymethylglutaryl-CoA synthase [Lactobacillus sp.]MDN6042567.1 hydroxymethylglutaryl-CoA synthase [Lactobacillus sp.]MDN6052105.1 hydroxymethylglutaryl-CoA synthase [Lactobacillus sp.]
MNIGIDQIGFFTPNKYLDTVELAKSRGIDPNKVLLGIGQQQMAVADQTQDIVAMGINATLRYWDQVDVSRVGLLIVATESGIDQSKATALFMKQALHLPGAVRAFEVKEACYGLTAAVMIARDYLAAHPNQTALVIGSDIARYGLSSGGEVTQGAGSISLLLSTKPAILALRAEHSNWSDDINDFWRPNESPFAKVDGKYSKEVYLDFFTKTFKAYQAQTGLSGNDFSAIVYHLPFTKMGFKANQLALADLDETSQARLSEHFIASKQLAMRVGNIYTGSLYLSLLSLLEQAALTPQALIGLFSYGSGAIGEFFAGELQAGYDKRLSPATDMAMLDARQHVSVAQYEALFEAAARPPKPDQVLTSDELPGRWYFAGTKHGVRQYRQQ